MSIFLKILFILERDGMSEAGGPEIEEGADSWLSRESIMGPNPRTRDRDLR